jgi:hypothetical protein
MGVAEETGGGVETAVARGVLIAVGTTEGAVGVGVGVGERYGVGVLVGRLGKGWPIATPEKHSAHARDSHFISARHSVGRLI